jgi:competence protein ComEC
VRDPVRGPDPPEGSKLRLLLKINAVRWALTKRIVARMGPRLGGVAAAMTTGHEAWLERDTLDAMRDSGLAHVLSISGLHMAVVGGFVFFAVRAASPPGPGRRCGSTSRRRRPLAGWSRSQDTWCLRRAAAGGAAPRSPRRRLPVPSCWTARASVCARWRSPPLRAGLQPEAVVQPGFQMSFAATTALIALAERWPTPIRRSTPWPIVRGADAPAAGSRSPPR